MPPVQIELVLIQAVDVLILHSWLFPFALL
jgi:hypothetical protein